MAQLRDAHTSELIAEGTPWELINIAEELGLKAGVVGIEETADELGLDAIYDDVGLGFNPDAVRESHAESRQNMAEAAKATKATKATRELNKDAVASMDAEAVDARATAQEVGERLEAIRENAPSAAPSAS